ncbi:MAG: ParB N-terminal domain-containing protein [Vicinamibacterales bacterium]
MRKGPETVPDADPGDLPEQLDGTGEPSQAREGLPPTYRMRHDAHYVDRLLRPASPPVRMVALADIDHAPGPRAADVAHLMRSIQRFGILQPLLVRRKNGRYELIAGARRLAAAAAAGLSEIPCIVHEADEWHARALADAANLRDQEQAAAPRRDARVSVAMPASVLGEVTAHLEAIGSSLNLFSRRGRPLRERVAHELIEAEVQRAARLAQGLAVLAEDPALARRPVDLRAMLRDVVNRMRSEQTLAKVEIVVDEGSRPVPAWADDRLMSIGLASAIGGFHAMVEQVPGACVRAAAGTDESRATAMVEISESAVALPPAWLARFFDVSWTDRPGRCLAAVGFASARRIVELHGGNSAISVAPDGGCILRLEFPPEPKRQLL